MASPSQSLHSHENKRMQTSALDIPVEIWDEIISKLNHHDLHLQSLSRVSKYFLSITNRHKQTLKIFDPTAHFLPSLFSRFHKLKHLSLSDFSGDPAPVLLQLADFNHRLESLHIDFEHEHEDEYLPVVEALQQLPASTLIGVTSLKIGSVSAVRNDDLLMIANSFPNLDELDLAYYKSDDDDDGSDPYDDAVDVLTSKLKGLRRVYLDGHRWLSDKGLISLSKNCPNLERISVKSCPKVTPTGMEVALQAFKNLKMFGLEFAFKRKELIGKPLSRALSLSEIDMSYSCVSDDFLFTVVEAHLPLKSVTLNHCNEFTYDGISSFLTSYNSLNHLALAGTDFLSDKDMITLAKYLTQLRSVDLDDCVDLSNSTLHTLIKRCHLLETITMRDTNIGKEKGFRVRNAFNPNITTLDLFPNSDTKVSNGSLKKIALACPNLQTLRLGPCVQISAEGVGEIFRNCRRIKHLDIIGCVQVESLDLPNCNTLELEFLEASRTGFKDKALIDISKKCSNLMFLDVMGCGEVTCEGVGAVVEKCTKLKEINLYMCRKLHRHLDIARMISSRPSLRKIIPPKNHVLSADEERLFMRQGCYVSNREYESYYN